MLFVLLLGCGPTSYSKAATAHPIGRDRWVIEVRGKRIGLALLLEYQQRKAVEVCPDGGDGEQSSGGEETTEYVVTINSTAGGTQCTLRFKNWMDND